MKFKCSRCKEEKGKEDFHKDNSRKYGIRSFCKKCSIAYNKKYRKENKEKVNAKQNSTQRERRLKHKYGLTLECYDRMLKEQEGKCKICKSNSTKSKKSDFMFVDHCHSTGKVRGLLCHNCNSALGKFQESKEILEEAIRYLDESTKI